MGVQDTSLKTKNSGLSRIYGKLAMHYPETLCGVILDYGGGRTKFDALWVKEVFHGTVVKYDPYWCGDGENKEALERKDYHTIVCSNVLNVILSPQERRKVLEALRDKAKETGAPVFIVVFEGDRSGKVSSSSHGTSQLNKRTRDYLEEVRAVMPLSLCEYGMIVVPCVK